MSEKSVNQILDTSVDINWLQKTLVSAVFPGKSPINPTVTSWSAEKIAQGLGFLSHIVKVKLLWSKKNTGNMPGSVILKIPTIESVHALSDEFSMNLNEESFLENFVVQVHFVECTFYDLWKTEATPCKIPRCFFAQSISKDKNGLLVFEDFSAVGMIQSLYDGLNLPQMLEIAENIARIQAWSLTHSERISKYFWSTCIPIFDELHKDYPQMFTADLVNPLYENCKTVDDFYYIYSIHSEFNMTPVLVHGDLWINNLMLKKEVQNGVSQPTNELLGFIDWQLAHAGCAMEDLARCIWSSAQENVRREHLHTVIAHYYFKLKQLIGKDPPFSYDLLLKCWNRLIKYGLLVGVAPVVLITKVDPRLVEDKQKIDSMIIRAKNALEDAVDWLL